MRGAAWLGLGCELLLGSMIAADVLVSAVTMWRVLWPLGVVMCSVTTRIQQGPTKKNTPDVKLCDQLFENSGS